MASKKRKAASETARIAKLEAEIKRLKGLDGDGDEKQYVVYARIDAAAHARLERIRQNRVISGRLGTVRDTIVALIMEAPEPPRSEAR